MVQLLFSSLKFIIYFVQYETGAKRDWRRFGSPHIWKSKTFLAWIPDSNPPSKKLNHRNSESGLSYMEQNGSLHKRLKIAICWFGKYQLLWPKENNYSVLFSLAIDLLCRNYERRRQASHCTLHRLVLDLFQLPGIWCLRRIFHCLRTLSFRTGVLLLLWI